MDLSIDTLFFLVELLGTAAFAASGAVLAIERGLDLFGIVFLGCATAIGGGVLRDVILGQIPPQAFVDYAYMLTAAMTSLLVFVWARVRRWESTRVFVNGPFMNVLDAAGLGIFSVIGVRNTILAGFGGNMFFCVFLGMTTGVGGGMLRDILSHTTPAVLRKRIYALASIAGAVCYYLMRPIAPKGSIAAATLLVVVLRVLASRYRWTLPHIDPPENKD